MQAAGIADPTRAAGLLEYLAGLGFTADEMAEAERRGRLFGLGGDVLLSVRSADLHPADSRRLDRRDVWRTSNTAGPCSA